MAYLRDALKSVQDQDYRPLEVVISDDSTDELTGEWIRTVPSDDRFIVRYHRNVQPVGQAANINQLLKLAAGERLLLLHDDDMLIPGALQALAHAFDAHPDTAAVYGRQRICDDSGRDLGDKVAEDLDHIYSRTPSYYGRQPSPLASAILRQFPNNGYLVDSALARSVGCRSGAEIGNACDADFGVRFAIAANERPFVLIPQPTTYYRRTTFAVSRSSHSGSDFWTILQSLSLDGVARSARKQALRRLAPVAARDFIEQGMRGRGLAVWLSHSYGARRFKPAGIYCLATAFFPALSRLRSGARRSPPLKHARVSQS